jgi:long-chain acyl-CoA synthetase
MTFDSRPWLNSYPSDIPANIDTQRFTSLVEMLETTFEKNKERVALSFLGREMTYAQLDEQSQAFAAYLQSLGLVKGDRVAAMLPNVMQYPVVVAGVLRAGCVLVNVNPLYTTRELEHQLKDADVKAIVILENFAATLQACLPQVQIEHTVMCAMGDSLGFLKGSVVNHVVRRIKKMVPPYSIPHAVRWSQALSIGRKSPWVRVPLQSNDLALLQYTGGTTGIAKGAELLHSNLLANMLQADAWMAPISKDVLAREQLGFVCALPLYHIFSFTINLMFMLHIGAKALLIPNPRDLNAMIKEMAKFRVHILPGVNTLFNALVNHADFLRVDWSHLIVTLGGGTAVQSGVAKRWLEKTSCPICEGYGLSETSPVVSCNLLTTETFTGTIGLPFPGTDVKIVDDDERRVTFGQPGEIVVKGPQVMAGYWRRPDETARALTFDGYFKTGDVGVMDMHGFVRIVDRKKDTILVSGFNVYPNEIEDVVSMLPEVLECAAVGVPDERTGEAIQLFVVLKSDTLSEEEIRKHCRANLTNYKNPKQIVFKTTLPKTPIGKVLRRELRGVVQSTQ